MEQLTKKQVLKIVKNMHFYWRWSAFFNTDFGNTKFGFCHFLNMNEDLTRKQQCQIIEELYNDSTTKVKNYRDRYWYENYSDVNKFQPRLQHLKRTIKRLKNEINDCN